MNSKLSFNENDQIISYLDNSHKRILYMTNKSFHVYVNSKAMYKISLIHMLDFKQLTWFLKFYKKKNIKNRLMDMAIKADNIRLAKELDKHGYKSKYLYEFEVTNYTMLKWLIDSNYISRARLVSKAINTNDIQLLKSLSIDLDSYDKMNIYKDAIFCNNTEIADWLINNGYIEEHKITQFKYERANIHLYKRLYDNDYNGYDVECLFDHIAESEDLDLLRYALEVVGLNYPKEEAELESRCGISGDSEIFKYLYIRNALGYHDTSAYIELVKNGDIELLQWIYDHGGKIDNILCVHAINHHEYDILKWLYGIGRSIKDTSKLKSVYKNIIIHGTYELFVWIYEQLRTWNGEDLELTKTAVLYNEFDILKYARYHNCQWNTKTILCYAINRSNSIYMIEWLVKQGVPITVDVVIQIIKHKRYDMLREFRNYPSFPELVINATKCIKDYQDELNSRLEYWNNSI